MSASHEGFARPLPVKSSEERIKEIQTGIVSEIKGNKSTGRSWQFNAPVVGKQINQVVGRKTYQYVSAFSSLKPRGHRMPQ